METAHPIAKIMVEKGLSAVNTTMFSKEEKEAIFSEAADALLRLNRVDEALIALEKSGRPMPEDLVRKIADERMIVGKYAEAHSLFVKIGDQQMAEFLRLNFL